MKAYYIDDFVLPLPPEHRFPMAKYALLSQRVKVSGVASLHIPRAATDEQILRCHDLDYLEKIKRGTLTAKEVRRMGFPWSTQMLERSRRSVGATIEACLSALSDGVSVNLAGGTHHACRDHGEGFCIFNDVAVAARDIQARGLANRVVIIDCDVHQGNGTAQITEGDDTIFTFSIHGEKNFPFRKCPSNLDISLPDRTPDAVYLSLLEEAIRQVIFLADADVAIYVSGADPFVDDRLGKLALTKAGLAARDRLVIESLRNADLPVAVTMGGGYAHNVNDIVDIHFQTVKITSEFYR